jgi:hypothetical protein
MLTLIVFQLNLYGYRRVPQGADKGAYWHPNFIRGQKSQCKSIRRKKTNVKLAPTGYGSMIGVPTNSLIDPHSLSVRQMIADGQLSAEHRFFAATQQSNPMLAAALMMEKQRQQTDFINQIVLRQHQEQRLEQHLLDQQQARGADKKST